ncbi:MAG: putative peptidoglycan glycosyltransferase FtsW [Pseudoclavibacter sp.]|nr:putative peptidoglycan glycosyltransferase FtsW [Pseudoclavibacter sp.]
MTRSLPRERTRSAATRRPSPARPPRSRGVRAGRFTRVVLGDKRRWTNWDATALWAITVFLVGFGLLMVWSSSSVELLASGGQSVGQFLRQAAFAFVGLLALLGVPLLGRRLRGDRALVVLALTAMAGSVVLQFVCSFAGVEVQGNRAWLRIGDVQFQPVEFTKLATVLWIATAVRLAPSLLQHPKRLLAWLAPPLAGVLAVVLGRDLGSAMVLLVLMLGALCFAGLARSLLLGAGFVGTLAVMALTAMSPNRMERIFALVLDTCDYRDECWQSTHSRFALAAGGPFGVGLGNSRAKWSWLPEADNDFIFAIIGEEFGLVGALVVLACFGAIAVILIRMIMRTREIFARAVLGAVVCWITFQALVNIAVVIGVLPVLGVPLPFVSAGGTSLITTLAAIGMVVWVAPDERGASAPAAPARSKERIA